jgi:DNA polymerase-3 subunit delta
MRIVVLHGKELFLLWERSRQFIESLREAHGDVGVVRLDGAAASLPAVLDELQSFGLLEPHRLVIIDDADRFLAAEPKRRAMERYAERPEAAATLLLRATQWRPGNLDKMIAKVGAVVACEPVPEPKAAEWCVERIRRRHGGEIERAAATLLVERIGSDLGRLDGELAKLAAAGDGGRVGIDLVRSMVGPSREEEAWLLQEVLLQADPAAAVRKIRELIEISRAAPQQLTWGLSDLARKLHEAASLREAGRNEQEIAASLRLWGPSRALILAASKHRGSRSLAASLHRSVDLDFRIKRGRAGDPARALEAAAAAIAAEIR